MRNNAKIGVSMHLVGSLDYYYGYTQGLACASIYAGFGQSK